MREGKLDSSCPRIEVLPDNEPFEGRVESVLSASAAFRLLGRVKVDFLFCSGPAASKVGAVVMIAGVLGTGGVDASACSFAVLDSWESEACRSFSRLNLCFLEGCNNISGPRFGVRICSRVWSDS